MHHGQDLWRKLRTKYGEQRRRRNNRAILNSNRPIFIAVQFLDCKRGITADGAFGGALMFELSWTFMPFMDIQLIRKIAAQPNKDFVI
jgi:hypothetical protein